MLQDRRASAAWQSESAKSPPVTQGDAQCPARPLSWRPNRERSFGPAPFHIVARVSGEQAEGAFELYDLALGPATIDYHVHEKMDETLCVVEGAIEFNIAGQISLRAGRLGGFCPARRASRLHQPRPRPSPRADHVQAPVAISTSTSAPWRSYSTRRPWTPRHSPNCRSATTRRSCLRERKACRCPRVAPEWPKRSVPTFRRRYQTLAADESRPGLPEQGLSGTIRTGPEPARHHLAMRPQALHNSGRGAVWLAHLLWEQGVGGSNPLAPT